MKPLVRARLATIALFFAAGFAMSMWVANIPAIESATGLSHALLGSLILLLGLGSVIGMQVAGFLIDRWGSRAVATGSLPFLAVGVLVPGWATDTWGVGIGLVILGLGQGLVDVSMNDQAVVVERRWGKAIMSSFHAFFSVGGAVGALTAALMQTTGIALPIAVMIGAGIAVVIAGSGLRALLPRSADLGEDQPEPTVGDRDELRPHTAARPARGTVALLALLAFLLMLAEGSANDWSALHAVKELGVDPAAGALAYGAFAVAMTVGRFATDGVVRRVGPERVVQVGSLIAVVGCLLVALGPSYPVVVGGWAVFGLGLSGTVPQIFTAAGNLGGPRRGTLIARVVGAGYVGFMAGPAIIGWAAELVGLGGALLIPAVLCVVALALTFVARSAFRR